MLVWRFGNWKRLGIDMHSAAGYIAVAHSNECMCVQLTWLKCCATTVLGFPRQVVVHQALVLWAEVLQGPMQQRVDDLHSVPKQGLQKPQLSTDILQAVLHHNDGCHDLQLAGHRLCTRP